MNHDYQDILDLIVEPPRWWDEHAVPRWCEFHPEATANIYADEALLMLIECQDCGHEFHVCMSVSRSDVMMRAFDRRSYEAWELLQRAAKRASKADGVLIDLDAVEKIVNDDIASYTLADAVRDGEIHYGDPPNACPADCAAGATMNSVPKRVVEFWSRDSVEGQKFREWTRHPELEIEVTPEWATADA
jgi:hypothetical protein